MQTRYSTVLFLVLVTAGMPICAQEEESPPPPPIEISGEPSGPTTGSDSAPPKVAEPITPEQEVAIKAFIEAENKWADSLIEMKATAIRYSNDEQRSPAAKQRYYDLRDQARKEMDETFQAAVEVFRLRKGDFDAGSLMATMLEYRKSNSIYENSAEAADMLLELDLTYPFIYLMAARGAFVDGNFDRVMKPYEAFVKVNGPEKLERVDNMLVGLLDIYPLLWERERELRAAEAKADDLPRVLLETTRGPVVIELFEDQAPNTVANFIRLVESGFYDGSDFYQVMDDFLAQGGDPIGDGSGTSGRFIADEAEHADARKFFRGYLSMVKAPNPSNKAIYLPNTASSQFAIALMPLFRKDESQTVFGCIVEGLQVACSFRRIDPSEKKEKSIQLPPDRIITAKVLRKRDHEYKVNYVNQ